MAPRKGFPVDMSFTDRQGQVVHPSREDYNSRKSANVGEAYALFDCSASKEDIEAELPFIRSLVKTPQKLELLLTEGVTWDSKLGKELQTHSVQSIKEGRERSIMLSGETLLRVLLHIGCRYFMQAKYPNATNEKTADELAVVLNQAYQSPLYQVGEPPKGVIVYKEGDQYTFRE